MCSPRSGGGRGGAPSSPSAASAGTQVRRTRSRENAPRRSFPGCRAWGASSTRSSGSTSVKPTPAACRHAARPIERPRRDGRLHQSLDLSREPSCAGATWRAIHRSGTSMAWQNLSQCAVVEHEQVDPALVGGLISAVARHAELAVRFAFRLAQQLRFQLHADQVSRGDMKPRLVESHFDGRGLACLPAVAASRRAFRSPRTRRRTDRGRKDPSGSAAH